MELKKMEIEPKNKISTTVEAQPDVGISKKKNSNKINSK